MVASRRSVSPSVPGPSPKGRSSAAPPGSIPTSHYNPSTGSWDGQLPNPGIADQLSPAGILEKPPDTWPTIIQRDGFADVATVTFNLTGSESAVLRRVLFRAGSVSQGCWESLANMGRYLGYNERTVRRALERLLGLGLVHKVKAFHGDGKSNCYVPVLRIPHFGHNVQNGENEASILDIMSAHSGHNVQQTERTDSVTNPEFPDPELQESQDAGDSKLILSSVHFGHYVQNELPPSPISDTMSEMGGERPGDITECGSCGLPWTSDPGRHWTALRRGMRIFVCDTCRDAQIAVVGGIESLAAS